MNQPETTQKGMIAWFAGNGVASNLLMIFIIAAGIASVFFIKIQIFPEFEMRTLQASMVYPGAAPEEVEQAIVIPMEEALQDLTGVSRLRGTAREGVGFVSLEIATGYDVDELLDEAKSRIDSISTFPDGVERPEVRKIEVTTQVLNVSIYGNMDDKALKAINFLAIKILVRRTQTSDHFLILGHKG